MTESRLLKVDEVADVLRCSRMTVYRIIRSGALRALHIGRNFRVREQDLSAYLDAQSTT